MATKRHQFILGLVLRKMRLDGCNITAVDGHYPGLMGTKVPMPPRVGRHRPDAVGAMQSGRICIGEAKTEEDAFSTRSIEQLLDFTNTELNGHLCEVYVGVPSEIEDAFKALIRRHQLHNCDNLQTLYFPNEIISG